MAYIQDGAVNSGKSSISRLSGIPPIPFILLPRPRRYPADAACLVCIVTITLSSDGDFPDTLLFPDRWIKLSREKPTFSIGRSSKVQSKGFVASLETGWFDNQVMSRKHAEITVNLDSMVCPRSPRCFTLQLIIS